MSVCPPPTVPIWEIKRLLEYYLANPEFREHLRRDPLGAAAQCGLTFDPNLVRGLWDWEARSEQLTPLELAYTEFVQSKLALRERIRQEGTSDQPRYRCWRDRQIARMPLEVGPAKADSIIHAPMAIELSKGCSVGCWFCGISADKLSEHFEYTPENATLWRGCLDALRQVIGPGARWGFCYWATDPLDNPDYEKFCLDFQQILGMFPQTTTALAHKDPARTRRLLALSESRQCPLNRFSILTLGLFRRIFAEFTAEELKQVECLAQNRESMMNKAKAGKARDLLKKEAEQAGADYVDDPNGGTIACVSGFLLNMVERTVRLVSPCLPSDRWPLGYLVLEEGRFSDAASLQALVQGMCERCMPSHVRELKSARWAGFLSYQEEEDGFSLVSEFRRISMRDPKRSSYLRLLGRSLVEGTCSAETLGLSLSYQARVPVEKTVALLDRLFQKGLLDEEPAR